MYKNHKDIVFDLDKEDTDIKIGKPVEFLGIDVNCLIHSVCQEQYNYGNKKSYLRKKEKVDVNAVYAAICEEIEGLVSLVHPTKEVFLAIDGVAGMSKVNQQRQRRFQSARQAMVNKDTKSINLFDSNSISTGTVFLYEFGMYLKRRVLLNMKKGSPVWKNLEVIISDDRVPGEGEHKIINYLRSTTTVKSSVIYSVDADLIILALSLPIEDMYILRRNMYDHIMAYYFVVHIRPFVNLLVNNYIRKVYTKDIIQQIKLDRVAFDQFFQYHVNSNSTRHSPVYNNIFARDEDDEDTPYYEQINGDKIQSIKEDFIFLMEFAGNDFLPNIKSFEIPNKGLETILGIYPLVVKRHGHFLYRNINSDVCLNIGSIEVLFGVLSIIEKSLILTKINSGITYFPDPLLEKYTFPNKSTPIPIVADKNKEQTMISSSSNTQLAPPIGRASSYGGGTHNLHINEIDNSIRKINICTPSISPTDTGIGLVRRTSSTVCKDEESDDTDEENITDTDDESDNTTSPVRGGDPNWLRQLGTPKTDELGSLDKNINTSPTTQYIQERLFDDRKYKKDVCMEEYVKEYNKKKFNGDVDSACFEYLKGVLFTMRYYITGIPDWQWYYPLYASPFFIDLFKYANKFDGAMTFTQGEPLTNFEQLACILPKRSFNLLPLSYSERIRDNERLEHLYPIDFEINLEGKRYEYEGKVILPFIDIQLIRDVLKDCYLTYNEEQRNIREKSIRCFNMDGVPKFSKNIFRNPRQET